MSEPLEIRIAHLTRTIEDLSDVVARQQKELDRLTHHVTQLRQRAAEAEADATGAVVFGDERPPHY